MHECSGKHQLPDKHTFMHKRRLEIYMLLKMWLWEP